jgi:signal transduction histidine kinase
LIFLGENHRDAELVAVQGHRADGVLKIFYPGLSSDIERLNEKPIIETRWESESMLLAGLALPESYFGYMILGPKKGGEIFLPEERLFIANIAPVLALAIDKSVQSQQLRELNWQLTKTGERERGNIASDIHDGPLQKAILLGGVGNGKVQDDFAGIAKELAAELREICSRLRPAILDHLGAVSAIEWLLDEAKKRHRISIELSLFNLNVDDRFAPDIELTLFRVTQEAINNTVKHANADSITVLLAKEENTLVLEISDDGEGITRQVSFSSSGGFGLAGMKERVIQVKGSFEVQTTPGVGTTITVQIPLEDKSGE